MFAPPCYLWRRVLLSCPIVTFVRKFFSLLLLLFLLHFEYSDHHLRYASFRGGLSNFAYTFGGRYNGFGDRKSPSSYTNAVVPGVSTDPRRVNTVMYKAVASSSCLAVPTTTPTQKPTTQKPQKPRTTAKPSTRRPTQKPTKRSPTRKPTPLPTEPPTLFETPVPTFFPTDTTPLPTSIATDAASVL
jgi:hypothetical protein